MHSKGATGLNKSLFFPRGNKFFFPLTVMMKTSSAIDIFHILDTSNVAPGNTFNVYFQEAPI
jgi:hypothetical protein